MESRIAENIERVRERVAAAAKRVGRDPKEVTLIAVSKTKPVEMLSAAYMAGERQFGENKVQELCAKFPVMPKDTVWHMIGHLQTNKVRQVIDKAALIHSVDNIKLAQVIQSEAEKKERICNVLLEVNIAGEDSKYGLPLGEVERFVREIAGFDRIRICGLMTVAPFTENPEENREYFRQMKRLAVDISAKNIDNVSMKVLSMGMTGDYEVAVEEGATMIRIGTGIFGEREYNIKE